MEAVWDCELRRSGLLRLRVVMSWGSGRCGLSGIGLVALSSAA